jgi:uncharacterized damage-inducible protein DinB
VEGLGTGGRGLSVPGVFFVSRRERLLYKRSIEDYLRARVELDEKIADFSAELTEEDFTQVLKLNDSHGTPMEKNFGGAVLHGFNHETHHRGMISLYLEQLGKPNDFSSLRQVVGK